MAPDLVGCLLVRKTPQGVLSGMVVETEAYAEGDPASHSFRGKTDRNRPMFREGGRAYVYVIYGIHHCFNVTTGAAGDGQAVLIRALQPISGIGLMMEHRGTDRVELLCKGPGRLCSAMGIDKSFNGMSLLDGNLRIMVPRERKDTGISVSSRTGITKGVELKWRYFLEGSPWVSTSRRVSDSR